MGATPADAVRPVVSRISALMRRATVTPSGSPHAFSVTSRYASSSESGSTSGVTARKMANTCCDTRPVLLEVGADDDEAGAEPDGARHRNGGADAEAARLVAGRGDHAALAGRRRRRQAARAATGCRAARRTHRTRPCRCEGSCAAGCGAAADSGCPLPSPRSRRSATRAAKPAARGRLRLRHLLPLDVRRRQDNALCDAVAAFDQTGASVMFSTWIFTSSPGPQ